MKIAEDEFSPLARFLANEMMLRRFAGQRIRPTAFNELILESSRQGLHAEWERYTIYTLVLLFGS